MSDLPHKDNLPHKACWRADDAKAILATEATVGDKEIFLATHSPISDLHIGGTRGGDIEKPTEQGLLDALSSPNINHAFCVVEGEPGSGKSHLIRWLHTKWPIEDDLLLLIQRLDGSLGGTLQQLQRKLPAEHQHLFDSVVRTQNITLIGRARVFQSNLAHSLKGDFFEKPLMDAEWCDKWDLANLLGKQELIDNWKAPERVLNILSGKKGERNQELARFNVDDIAQLAKLIHPLNLASRRATRFGRDLEKEAEGIQQLTREEKSDPSRQDKLRQDFEITYKFVDALNLRRNNAVQSLLGISSEGLKELFMRLRRELKNRRLVLLLEDITSWEGIDNQLIDVLVTNVDAREDKDLCPMISVVGITPEYFRNAGFQANYRQRITHDVRLGEMSAFHQYQDVSSLRTTETQIAFAAKYLRAVRAGSEKLSYWDDTEPVPNVCTTCPYMTDCHAVFGEYQGTGLYPFNKNAITTIFAALEDPKHLSTQQTPRGMIQGVLVPTLSHSTVVDVGEYPGEEIESAYIPEERKRISGLATDILRAQASDDREFNRLRRLVAYWGRDSDTHTQKGESGFLEFFSIPEGIYESFGLPWLGGDESNIPATAPIIIEQPSIQEGSPSTSGEPLTTRDGSSSIPTQPKTKQTRTTSVSRAELRKLENEIAAWMEGKRLDNPSKMNRIAYDIVNELPWQHLGISEWIRGKLFTTDTVILKGTKQERIQHFVLPNLDWTRRGMEAFVALKTMGDELDAQHEESYQRRFASMIRSLKKSATNHVQNRLSLLDDNTSWSLVSTATQVLLARAWLRGVVSPIDPAYQQWRVLLKDEDAPTSNPQDRVDSWGEAVKISVGSHGKLREMLKRWVVTNQGDSSAQGLVDPGDAVSAIAELGQTFRLSPFPKETRDAGTQLAELTILVRDAKEMHQRLPGIPKFEKDRLIRLAKAIDTMLRHSTIREHLQRLDKIIQEATVQLPSTAPMAVKEWIKTYHYFKELGYTNATGDTAGQFVEGFIDNLSDVSLLPSDAPAAIFDWALNAPAGSIKTTYEGLNQGETVIQALLDGVESFLSNSPSGQDSLKELHMIGKRLNTTSTSVLNKLNEETDD